MIFQDPKETHGFSSLPLPLTCLSHPHLTAFLSLLASFSVLAGFLCLSSWFSSSATQSGLPHTGAHESPAWSLWPVLTPWPLHMYPANLIHSVHPPDSVTRNLSWPHFSQASLKSGLTFLPSISFTLFPKLTQRPPYCPFWSMNNWKRKSNGGGWRWGCGAEKIHAVSMLIEIGYGRL